MSISPVRLRFAPAPTGMMHLGNIRTALMNALYAQRHNGTFVLRIEDTDPQRNYDKDATHIIADLTWLGITYDEGPRVGGPYTPYFQSQRLELYQTKLDELIRAHAVYRCFCTEQELNKKRDRQRALKLPPRYDRTCLNYSDQKIEELLAANTPFLWRFKLDHAQTIVITDLAHKNVTFELKHFSDFPLTRQNGTFTFMFANCIDDIDMRMTHVFRGKDHLSNTACQAALYHAFNAPLPIFWHMPILCNTDGKKLSKRDFGFSLRDLKDAGFTSDALVNYLGIIGGSYSEEFMTFEQLAQTLDLDNPKVADHITYDVEKLRWINRKWIESYTPEKLYDLCKPVLHNTYPSYDFDAHKERITNALQIIKTDMHTLNDCVEQLQFMFNKPALTRESFASCIDAAVLPTLAQGIHAHLSSIDEPEAFVQHLKAFAKEKTVPLKYVFWFVRLALTSKTSGPGIHELVHMLGTSEARTRIETALSLVD